MTIIFDFNRTLYEPETGALVPGALSALTFFSEKGADMHLVSRLEPGRGDTLEKLGIRNFFASLSFVRGSKEDAIAAIAARAKESVYYVDDYLPDIAAANRTNAKTIWLKRGRFAHLTHETEEDSPWRTIEHLDELRDLLN